MEGCEIPKKNVLLTNDDFEIAMFPLPFFVNMTEDFICICLKINLNCPPYIIILHHINVVVYNAKPHLVLYVISYYVNLTDSRV